MKQKFEISEASSLQLNLIQELAYQIWPTYYSSIISMEQVEYMLRELYSLESLQKQLEQGQSFYLVWEKLKAIGFMGLSEKGKNEMKLDKLYLDENYRGSGIGKKMMRKAEEICIQKNKSFLILNVNRFNPSLAFYKKSGFRIREQVDIVFGPFWLNDYVMEKEVI